MLCIICSNKFIFIMFFIYYYFILIIYICCAKKSKKRKKNKIKSQSRHSKRQERKKKLKKNIQSRQPVTDWHVSGKCSFPPFETAGMGKTTKKKPQKWKWVILEIFFQRGSDLKIFLTIGSGKKNSEISEPTLIRLSSN